MSITNIISFFFAGLSLFGNYLINKQNVKGYYVWIVANICWGCLYYYIDQKGSVFLMSVYLIFCIHGIYTWNKIKGD